MKIRIISVCRIQTTPVPWKKREQLIRTKVPKEVNLGPPDDSFSFLHREEEGRGYFNSLKPATHAPL